MKALINLFAGAILVTPLSSYGQLRGEYLQNWVIEYIPACYKNQRASAVNSFMSDERLSKYCTCSAFKTGLSNHLSNELIDKFRQQQAKIPREIHSGVLSYCTDNYASYNSGALPYIRKSPQELVYTDGNMHRFVAIKRITQDLKRNQIDEKNIPLGSQYADISISLNPGKLTFSENDGPIFKTEHLATISDFGKIIGTDHGFTILDGIVSFDIEKSIMLVQKMNNNTYELTTFVLSKKLLCDSLSAKISQSNSQMIGNIVKEALIFAVKSYTGASYSYGTASGLTSSGNPFTANVTFYNNGWMGEHYSKGIDELLNGSSDVSNISKQKDALGCPR